MAFYIIIRGPLGCGKSTIAERLSKKLNAKSFSIDKILDKHNLLTEWEEGYISQKSFKKANEIISSEAREHLEKGISVIFDGNFYWKSQIEDLISKLNFPHHVFTLKVPLEVCIKRDQQREKPLGEVATKEVYKKSTEFDYGIIIDASKSLNETTLEIISHLPKPK
ncbi:ATP-binding protein [Candidatus Woesearchaeota archaeon]|jgi:tRNA uridine 5-carbamoylmethylation protein Kti12|nr:ATP-binding protein [Candidatus Woesearchaeota archaeon]